MADIYKNLGSNKISVSRVAYGYQFAPNIIINNSYSISPYKIVIGGMPLSLYESENGRYSLGIIFETGAVLNSNNYFIFGEAFYNFGVKENKNIMLVSVKNGANIYNDILYCDGMPLSLNINNYLIVSEFIPINTFDEEGLTYIGGIPVLIRRYGNNWFLVVQNI